MIIFVNNSVISSQFSLVVILGCSFAVSRTLNVINMSVKIILKTHEIWGSHSCGVEDSDVLVCDTGWVVPDILKDCSVFRVRHWEEWLLDCSRWAECPMMQRHIHDWIFFKSKTSNCWSWWFNIQSYTISINCMLYPFGCCFAG